MKEKVKKRLKKELRDLIILLCIFGIGYVVSNQYIEKEVEEWNKVVYIGYSNKVDYDDYVEYETLETLEAYEFEKELYSNFYYYDQLNESEKTVYNLLRFAYEKNLDYLFIDESICDECDYSLTDIASFLALDTPMLEQNLIMGEDDTKYTVEQQFLYKTVSRELKGSYIGIENFEKERTEKKELAVKEAKKIEFDFTETDTELEKARIIFNYLQDNIIYEMDEEKDTTQEILDSDYLYDAICEGATNCDGYANAFSLLCYFNDITCIEKMTPNDSEEIGHTWNSAFLDGKWYNVDATESADEEDVAEWYDELMINFAFSDATQSDAPAYPELLPECNSSLIPVARVFDKSSDDEVMKEIKAAFKETDEDYIVVTFKTLDKDEDEFLEDIVDTLWKSIYTYTLKGDACNVVVIKTR